MYPLGQSVVNWLYPPDDGAAGGVEGPLPRVDLPPPGDEPASGVEGPLPRVDLPPPGGAEPDEPEHPAEEARAARPSRDPGAPTQAMRDAHASTHLPFRSWCDECVQGRRDAPPHCRQKRSAGEVPEVAFDYAFIRRDDEEAVVTCLVMRARDSKAVRAWALERKGVDSDETVDRAVAGIRDLGYQGRVLIRCDGEPALTALRDAIIKALPDGATPVKTPVGESSSNGGIEGAIKIFKGLLRVHLAALERNVNAKFPSNHPALTWLVEHVADVISKYMVGVDGKTAYERLFGRPVREEGLEFGESLHWRHRPTKDMNVVLDTRWSSGVWLGRKWGGIVHQVFANGKVHEIRGVQRQPCDLRWQRASLEVLASTPWCREPAAPGELRVLPPLAPPAAGAGREVPEVADAPEYNPHRVFIKLADLERHGFTAGCRRCILMREGRRAQGIKHQDACRDRVEQALRDAGDPRLDRAEARVMEELGRRAAGVEALPPPAGVEVPPRGVELPPRGVEGPPRGVDFPPGGVEGPLPRVDLPPGGVDVPPRGVERPPAGGVEGPLPRVAFRPGMLSRTSRSTPPKKLAPRGRAGTPAPRRRRCETRTPRPTCRFARGATSACRGAAMHPRIAGRSAVRARCPRSPSTTPSSVEMTRRRSQHAL